MKRHVSILFVSALLWSTSEADERDPVHHFESRIRPVLVEHCYECHSVEAGKSKGGLLLDTKNGSREGGDTGPAVVPGDPEASLLFVAMSHIDPDLEMPPRKPKLSEKVIADFRQWIESGATDPRSGAITEINRSEDHWSYAPVTMPEIPAPVESDWPAGEIDRFVLAKLEKNGLEPSSDAEGYVLLRRLCFDLVGLPPTPEQMAGFSPDDLEGIVDELLASDGFGVRWGRHWLDVVRYAESNGRESNIVYPHAWRYRDYVIDAVSRDVPFDRFLIEQMAGDLLPFQSNEERARLLIATGFLALGAKGLNEANHEQFAADLADEQLDAFSRAFLASSIACARCHDHKSDPVSMEDYYSLIGIFKSTRTFYGTWIDSENNNGGELIRLPEIPGQLIPGRGFSKEKVAEMMRQLAELDEQDRKNKELAEKAKVEGKDMREDFNAMLAAALSAYWRRGGLEGSLATVDAEGNPLPLCMGAMDAGEAVDSPLYVRGELKSPDDLVPRGVPALFNMEAAAPEAAASSGRLALAEWVTSVDHPLTARVMANRVWSHLFGAGLVRTVDNFGPTGEAPSHPGLLDYLAVQFRENGYSVKKLVREIVLSRSYRQSSTFDEESFRKDPDNRLLWRAEKRRLDAEVIRDAMLAVSGELDLSPRPGSLAANLRSHSVSLIGFDQSVPDDLDGSLRRSVYLPVFRENLPDILDLFDFAEPSLVMGEREETNVPLQALYLMNSSFIAERSEAFAARLMSGESSRDLRIERAFHLCFNRAPDAEEMALIDQYFTSSDVDEKETMIRVCQALLCSAEFRLAD
ncbi:MAG: PSD1 and planctomycete cytochrome C domain-containing protein [Verrucomicrobiales bacterium]|nr:PSD1 and planctomycete cytochrome C domain-containing protein [Verrucomicrobiales bacterium]